MGCGCERMRSQGDFKFFMWRVERTRSFSSGLRKAGGEEAFCLFVWLAVLIFFGGGRSRVQFLTRKSEVSIGHLYGDIRQWYLQIWNWGETSRLEVWFWKLSVYGRYLKPWDEVSKSQGIRLQLWKTVWDPVCLWRMNFESMGWDRQVLITPQTSSIAITWELVRNADSQTPPWPTEAEPAFYKLPGNLNAPWSLRSCSYLWNYLILEFLGTLSMPPGMKQRIRECSLGKGQPLVLVTFGPLHHCSLKSPQPCGPARCISFEGKQVCGTNLGEEKWPSLLLPVFSRQGVLVPVLLFLQSPFSTSPHDNYNLHSP